MRGRGSNGGVAATRPREEAAQRAGGAARPGGDPLPPGDDARVVDAAALRAFVVAHLVPGVDALVADLLTRWAPTPDGPRRLVVDLAHPAATSDPLARRWLGLDRGPMNAAAADTDAMALAADPVVGPLVLARPGLVVPGSPDVFETAVMAVLGQQVSLAAARTFAGRLAARHGSGPDDARLFPTARDLADADPLRLREAVGVTSSRARTIVALAGAVAGGLELGPGGSRRDLLAVPGIGPWTADYVDLRCRRDPDAFLPGDLAVRRALGGVSAREAERLSQTWRPHRALALLHLWTAHALLPPEPRRRPEAAERPGDPDVRDASRGGAA